MMTTLRHLAQILILSLSLITIGCKSDAEPQIGGAKNNVETSTETPLENQDKTNKVDIIVPEVEVNDNNQQYMNLTIFELFDLFFKSFVSVVDEEPFDTRVNYKSMHMLRTERDPDFLHLVSIIEKRMAGYSYKDKDRKTQAAFLINVYNYAAIRLANKGYVQEGKMITSLRDLSKVFYKGEIEIRDTITLSNGIKSLSGILKEELRSLYLENDKMTETRFYLLANGATLGRGVLLNQAIFPDKLDAQMEFAAKNTVSMKRYAKLRRGDLEVARFFKWYKRDFEEAYGSLEDFFTAYGIDRTSYDKINYQDADYDLNDLALFTGPVLEQSVQPLPPIAKDEDIIPARPCAYLESEKVKVLSYCNQVIDGQANGFYKYKNEVIDTTLCVYTRDLGDGERSLGINGNVVEADAESGERRSITLNVEDKLKEKDDMLRIRIAEGVRTTLEYLQTDRRLMLRQTSVIPGKGYRKALIQCE
jgi:hypothetical protein